VALASAGAAMAQAAADALFLAEIGRDMLGVALAISRAMLAVVLAVAGGLADRLERRRVLGALALISALVLAGLSVLVVVTPAATAWLTYIGGKQLAAATDLAFWVVIAERIDARRSQRLLPVLAATGGAGAALGALVVIPLAGAIGPRGILFGAAVLLALAGLGTSRLPASRRVGTTPANLRALVARSWIDGARAVRRYPLAQHLAVVVAIAGVFGSLAYTSLGFAVAQRGGSAIEFASLFGGVRGAGQVVTLIVQIVVAPRLLARVGTGRALLLAPLVGLAAACGLVVAPILACAIATQMSSRVLDASIETPAEKLAQTLLPTVVRGRVGGFLDGTAKRAGAVIGGLIAALLAGAPLAFYTTIAAIALVWAIAARRIARELPGLAIEHVAGERVDADDGALEAVDDAALEALHAELPRDRPERAADVLARLHAQGRIDARAALVEAAGANVAVWRAVIAVLDSPAELHGPALLEAAQAATTRVRALAVRAVGLAGGVPAGAVDQWLDNADRDVALAAEVARLRLAGEDPLPVLADAIREPDARGVVHELVAECARADASRTLDAARYLIRAIRRDRGDAGARAQGLAILAIIIVGVEPTSEVALLRSDLVELARERIDRGASQPAPDTSLVSLMRPAQRETEHEAAEIAVALRLLGATSVDPDDLRRLARALGEPDDDVRAAAEDVLARLGPIAAGELINTAAWGRRRARDRAAALLADLPVTALALDRLVDAELDALEQIAAALAVLGEPGDALVAHRLDERLREIAHTVLLLVAARRRSQPIAKAAVAWRHARGAYERARTLAVIDAALPRALVHRLVEAVDDLTPADRAAALARA
ncbi:MAG: hypothetical protein ABI678_25360, partial [Kofleriaceae bacterium]